MREREREREMPLSCFEFITTACFFFCFVLLFVVLGHRFYFEITSHCTDFPTKAAIISYTPLRNFITNSAIPIAVGNLQLDEHPKNSKSF